MYPQSMFWSKNKKNRYTPAYPSFAIQKWGSRGYTLHGHVFLMENSVFDWVLDVDGKNLLSSRLGQLLNGLETYFTRIV